MNADGSNQTRLTYTDFYEFSPSFSPDGSKIIFTRMLNKKPKSSNFNEIFIINADGTGEKRITYNRYSENKPRFSPDGTKIYYSIINNNEKEEIWMMNLDGSKPLRLLELPEKTGNPAFSPDAQKIAFLSWGETDYAVDPYTRMEIWIMNADGSNQKQLTHTKKYKFSVAFSPDGLKIIFLEEERVGRGKGQICIINIDGSNLQVVANNY